MSEQLSIFLLINYFTFQYYTFNSPAPRFMVLEEKSPHLAQTFLKFDHSAPQFLTFQNVENKGHGYHEGGCPSCIWSVGQACLVEFRFQPLWLCVWFFSYLIGYRNCYWPKDSSCKVHSIVPDSMQMGLMLAKYSSKIQYLSFRAPKSAYNKGVYILKGIHI